MIILFRHHFDFRMFGISSLGWGKLTLKYSEDLDPDRRKKINIINKIVSRSVQKIRNLRIRMLDPLGNTPFSFLIKINTPISSRSTWGNPNLIMIHLGTPQSHHDPRRDTPFSSWPTWGHHNLMIHACRDTPNLIMIHVRTPQSHHDPLM